MRIDVIDERTLDRRHPDLDSGLRGTLKSLDLVAVVMGDQDAADPIDAERIEQIEGGSGPEADERTASTILNEIDIAGIGKRCRCWLMRSRSTDITRTSRAPRARSG